MTVQPTRDQLRALAHAATAGPWEVDDDNVYKAGRDGYGVAYDSTGENAAFIAAARNALPQLLDQLEQAEARIQAVQDVLDNVDGTVVTQADGEHVPVYLIRRALEG